MLSHQLVRATGQRLSVFLSKPRKYVCKPWDFWINHGIFGYFDFLFLYFGEFLANSTDCPRYGGLRTYLPKIVIFRSLTSSFSLLDLQKFAAINFLPAIAITPCLIRNGDIAVLPSAASGAASARSTARVAATPARPTAAIEVTPV